MDKLIADLQEMSELEKKLVKEGVKPTIADGLLSIEFNAAANTLIKIMQKRTTSMKKHLQKK